ncbi:MAG: hypothetical protein E7513_02620 [Ruminococcaceae bacterium]|nr:hypothetical protein [Oscillospiraceae bacterium]
MKKFVKRSLCMLFALLMMVSAVVCVSAEEVPVDENDGVQLCALVDPDVEPMADVIVWKYKTVNGVLYKRRWNETKCVWVDSAWIKV